MSFLWTEVVWEVGDRYPEFNDQERAQLIYTGMPFFFARLCLARARAFCSAQGMSATQANFDGHGGGKPQTWADSPCGLLQQALCPHSFADHSGAESTASK